MLACTNVNDHAWSGGGTHYASGEMYSPADTSDTSSSDTSAAEVTTLTPTADPTCSFQQPPEGGAFIACRSSWSEADAAGLEGGTVYVNLMDSAGTSLSNAALEITTTAGPDVALLMDGQLAFAQGGVEVTLAYTVAFQVANAEGDAQSEEFSVAVAPL